MGLGFEEEHKVVALGWVWVLRRSMAALGWAWVLRRSTPFCDLGLGYS